MTAKFVMLVLASVSLAACATATTDDMSVRRGASPTRGEISHHRAVVRGPVVPDSVVASKPAAHHVAAARPAHATSVATATKPAVTRHAAIKPSVAKPAPGSKYAAREVPNPLRQATTVPPPAASTGLPTEPVQPASVTEQPLETPPASPQSVIVGDVPVQDTPPSETTAPGVTTTSLLDFSNITPDTIEQMFGGMPFWLISVIAAALVATFGLAIRPKPAKDEEYEEPRVDDPEEDYREPYAA